MAENVTQPPNNPIQANIYDPGRRNPAPKRNTGGQAMTNSSPIGPIAPVVGKKPTNR